MSQKLINNDGSSTKSINPWDVDNYPEAWTWLSNAPKTTQIEQYSRVAAAFRAYAGAVSARPGVFAGLHRRKKCPRK